MKKINAISLKKARRKARIRAKISGTKEKPRLSVFRSNRQLYAQLIDDEHGRTLASASTRGIPGKQGNKTVKAGETGKLLAEAAKKAGIAKAVLDKGAYKYHGRIKSLADAARDAGLKL